MTVRIGFALLTLSTGLVLAGEVAAQNAPALTFEVDEMHVQLPSGTLFEDFNAYPLQNNVASGGADPSATVTNTAGEQIAIAQEGLVSAVGIVTSGVGRSLSVQTGAGLSDIGFLAILDVPGIGGFNLGGPFAVLNTGGRPDFSAGFSFAAGVREQSGAGATHFSFLIGDLGTPGVPDSTTEFFSPSFPLSSSFQTFSVTKDEFRPFPDEGQVIDFTKILYVSLEFFVGGAVDQCLSRDVDEDGEFGLLDVVLLRRILAGVPIPPVP